MDDKTFYKYQRRQGEEDVSCCSQYVRMAEPTIF